MTKTPPSYYSPRLAECRKTVTARHFPAGYSLEAFRRGLADMRDAFLKITPPEPKPCAANGISSNAAEVHARKIDAITAQLEALPATGAVRELCANEAFVARINRAQAGALLPLLTPSAEAPRPSDPMMARDILAHLEYNLAVLKETHSTPV